VVEFHLADGRVVRAPCADDFAETALKDAQQGLAWTSPNPDRRVNLSAALGVAYRNAIETMGGVIVSDDQGAIWNIPGALVTTISVVDLDRAPDAPLPRQVGFRPPTR
jgi:hypothetical protein